mmetsp:Transcript_24094/g.63559  ORF Transcript_24094/g.63559 Transcript_24094/m.63559 type:complete len:236 (+) Transcript_24094:1918-2625(+)
MARSRHGGAPQRPPRHGYPLRRQMSAASARRRLGAEARAPALHAGRSRAGRRHPSPCPRGPEGRPPRRARRPRRAAGPGGCSLEPCCRGCWLQSGPGAQRQRRWSRRPRSHRGSWRQAPSRPPQSRGPSGLPAHAGRAHGIQRFPAAGSAVKGPRRRRPPERLADVHRSRASYPPRRGRPDTSTQSQAAAAPGASCQAARPRASRRLGRRPRQGVICGPVSCGRSRIRSRRGTAG